MLKRFKEALAQSENQASPENKGQREAQENSAQENQAQNQQGQNRQRDRLARLSRLQEQAEQMVNRLQSEFNEDSGMLETLTNAGEPLNQSFKGELIGENADEFFTESVYKPLSQLELYILKRLDEIELQKKLYGMRKEEIPREYKKMVDKYFESIAK